MTRSTFDNETTQLLSQFKGYVGEMPQLKQAVNQLEEQMRGLPSTLENKLAAMRQTMYSPHGQYRGLLGSEATARGFGLYALAAVAGDQKAAAAFRSEFKDIATKAWGDTQASGGGLVPIEYATRIQRLVEEAGVFASNSFAMPMSSDSLTFQRRESGLTVYKTGSGQSVTGSESKFATINLNADEWNTLCLFPKSLEEDAAAELGAAGTGNRPGLRRNPRPLRLHG